MYFRKRLEMLYLDSKHKIGHGSHRTCYRHPENEDLCIKIEHIPNSKASDREKKYYLLLERQSYSWELVTKYHGITTTNLGAGEVFDLVKDHDGNVSKTLDFYLLQNDCHFLRYLVDAFYNFKVKMFDHALITSNLNPRNIAVRTEPHRFSFTIIDDIGNSEFLPISNYSSYFATKKVQRKWRRFEALLINSFPNSPFIKHLVLAEASFNEVPGHT